MLVYSIASNFIYFSLTARLIHLKYSFRMRWKKNAEIVNFLCVEFFFDRRRFLGSQKIAFIRSIVNL